MGTIGGGTSLPQQQNTLRIISPDIKAEILAQVRFGCISLSLSLSSVCLPFFLSLSLSSFISLTLILGIFVFYNFDFVLYILSLILKKRDLFPRGIFLCIFICLTAVI